MQLLISDNRLRPVPFMNRKRRHELAMILLADQRKAKEQS